MQLLTGLHCITFNFLYVCLPPPPLLLLPASTSVHGILQARILDGLPFSTLGDLPDPEIEPASLELTGRFFTTEPLRKLTTTTSPLVNFWIHRHWNFAYELFISIFPGPTTILSSKKTLSYVWTSWIDMSVSICICMWGLPQRFIGKESACNGGDIGDAGSAPEPGRSPGEGNSNPLQYSCLENSMYRGVWQTTIHGITKSWNNWSGLARIYT